jgi:FixJ family two-component response regulator
VTDPPGTVFVVDDDASLRKALRRLLHAAGYRVDTFASASEFLQYPHAGGPACLVLDLAMPGMGGLELQTRLGGNGWDPAIVFLTGHGEIRTSVAAMKNGAVDFLTKPVDEAELLAAIDAGLRAHRKAIAEETEFADARRHLASLTPREREVAALLVTGLRNKQVGFELGIAEKTVKIHRSRVLAKMEAGSVAELVHLWEGLTHRGLIEYGRRDID